MKPLPFERRLMAWSAVVVAVSLSLCWIGAAWFLYRTAVGQADRRLAEVAEQFYRQKATHGGPSFDPRDVHEMQEWLPAPGAEELVQIEIGGRIEYRSDQMGAVILPALSGPPQFIETHLGRMRVASFDRDGFTLRVAAPAMRVRETTRNLAVIFAVGLPLTLLLACGGGAMIARRAVAPIRRISDAAEQLTSDTLGRHVPVPEADDQIRRLATTLNDTFARLEASFGQARRFSADASHELKTPLTVLHSGLEALLQSPSLTERDRAEVADVLGTAKRLKAITSGLLLLAQADAGTLRVDARPLDLAELVADCLDDTVIVAEQNGIAVQFERPERAPCAGDPTRLRQIFGNLLDNAVKYNVPGGNVRVTLSGDGDDWILDVGNTGAGIPEAIAPRIFDRFFRAEHHAEISGQGLGLSLAHELARAHGGALELLQSEPGWTVFRVRLKRERG